MAYTDPPTFLAGDELTAAELNVLSDDIRALYSTSEGLTASGVQLNRTANQAISTSNPTYISWDSEQFDYGSWWSSGSTITVPAGAIPAGFSTIVVQLAASVKFAANSTGRRKVSLHRNGASIGSWQVSALNGDTTDLILPEWTTVAAGDTIQLEVWHDAGVNVLVNEARLTVMRYAPAA